MNIIIIFLLIIIISCIFTRNIENFEIRRKRRKGKKIRMGFLNNTPGPIKKLMTTLNKIGGQLSADKQYDTVAKDYLDKDKIK